MREVVFPILACRPTKLDLDDKLDRMAAESTFIYEGSVESTCKKCGRGVWVGPKAQELWTMGAPAYCFLCAVELQHEANGDEPPLLANLGNDEPIPPWVKKPHA